jgi:outer membrane murein-binding lipoprotein Lpp
MGVRMNDMKIFIVIGIICILAGCSTVQKFDTDMAKYIGVPALSRDCKAGIVQLDSDINPTTSKRGEAVKRYADPNSKDFKQCYSAVAWLYYTGEKLEGAVKSWAKKIVELGVMVP